MRLFGTLLVSTDLARRLHLCRLSVAVARNSRLGSQSGVFRSPKPSGTLITRGTPQLHNTSITTSWASFFLFIDLDINRGRSASAGIGIRIMLFLLLSEGLTGRFLSRFAFLSRWDFLFCSPFFPHWKQSIQKRKKNIKDRSPICRA